MGSSISSNKKKDYYGSAIFGYKSTTTTITSTTLVKSSSTLHLLTAAAAAEIDNIKEERKQINYNSNDNVLYQPSLYGLGSTANQSTFSQLSSLTAATITDCGAGYRSKCSDYGLTLYETNSQLYKDLSYVDKTYYKDEKEQQHQFLIKRRKQQMEQAERIRVQQRRAGDAITFSDIIQIYQQSMQNIDLSKKGLGSISSNIGLLPMIKKLDLSYNDLREIPLEIGYLKQLEYLNLSHNQIEFIPGTICHLHCLTEFNVSNNQLQDITPFIFMLSKLQTLNISYNQLKQITIILASEATQLHKNVNNNSQHKNSISSLTLLDISYNQITMLPAEITQLPYLRRLRLEGCPLTTILDHQFKLLHNPPSLLEICARLIIRKKANIVPPPYQPISLSPPLPTVLASKHQFINWKQKKNKKLMMAAGQQGNQDSDSPLSDNNTTTTISKLKDTLTESLYQYISNYKICSHCSGPYFDSFVSRGRWIDRNDVWIPLEYRLCSAHWSTESDRIYSLFSSRSEPTMVDDDLLPLMDLIKATVLPPLLPPQSVLFTVAATIDTTRTEKTSRRSCFFGLIKSNRKQHQFWTPTASYNNSPVTLTAVADYDETAATQQSAQTALQIPSSSMTISTITVDDQQQENFQQQQPEIRPRSSSSLAPATVALVTEPQHQSTTLSASQPQQQPSENFSLYSAVKRWNYKVRSNSSSLFRKNTAAGSSLY